MPHVSGRIDKIIGFLIGVTLVALPLFFLPITQDFYDTNKWMLLVSLSLLVLVFWAVRSINSNSIAISISKSTVGFLALSVASLVSLLLASPNKTEALTTPYGISLFLACTIIFLFGQIVFGELAKKLLRRGWYMCIAVLSLIAIYQFFGVGKTMFPKVAYLASELWTPVGSTLSLIAIFFITIPILVQDLGHAVRKKDDAAMALLFSVVLVVIAGTIVTVGKLIPLIPNTVLTPTHGRAITLEVLKDTKRAIFGVGSENFLYAFTTGRPLPLNSGPLWNLRFATNASVFLHVTATVGILGLIGLLFLCKSLLPKLPLSGSGITRIVALVSILFVPPSISLFVVFIVMLLLTEEDGGKQVSIELPPAHRWVTGALALIIVLFVVVSAYGIGTVYAAELSFFRSLTALQKNDGKGAYDMQIKSSTLAPQISRYHLAYSQTNLALANAIATNVQNNENGQPATLSDAERQTISNLIQQAIREAKIAVNLAPENVVVWENLATLYQSLINVVADVDQWAIATYQRAIQLDPTNPSLRLGLGGVFLLKNDAENAIQNMALAVNLKPDWANAHYNLGYAYKLRKDYLRFAYSLQQTVNYLPQGSDDRTKVETELAEVRKLLTPAQVALLEGRQPTQEEIQNQSQLTRPDAEPIPEITPKLQLPEDSSPPSTASSQVDGVQTEASNESPGTTQLGPEEANPAVQPQP